MTVFKDCKVLIRKLEKRLNESKVEDYPKLGDAFEDLEKLVKLGIEAGLLEETEDSIVLKRKNSKAGKRIQWLADTLFLSTHFYELVHTIKKSTMVGQVASSALKPGSPIIQTTDNLFVPLATPPETPTVSVKPTGLSENELDDILKNIEIPKGGH